MKRDNCTSIEEFTKKLIEDIVSAVLAGGGDELLSSLILTGSFGRDEPTYVINDSGFVELKSDVEIAAVYKRDRVGTERLIKKAEALFEEDVNLMALSESRLKRVCNFNHTLFPPRYKTMFTFDIFNGSKTIWGRDFLKERSVTTADCDIYEAKRLVANRIGELVCFRASGDVGTIQQWTDKTLLAVGGAWLMLKGEYASSYRTQRDIINASSDIAEEQIGAGFVEDYNKAFSYLREAGESFIPAEESLRIYVKGVYALMVGMRKPRVNSLSRLVKYALKLVRSGRAGLLIKRGFGFEDYIITQLIEKFLCDDGSLYDAAKAWDEVLH